MSNRLPVRKARDGWEISPGGLVTALRPVTAEHPGVWVGWDGGLGEIPRRVAGLDVDLAPVELTRAQVRDYYHGFANRTLWPLFHDLIERPVLDRSWWRAYQAVNESFAKAVATATRRLKNPLVWVQDYHLMLVPGLLRRSGGAPGPVGFFLHTPFPAPELFARLPWRAEILHGLLGADVVSFHTERYRTNFVRACGRLLTVDGVEVRGRNLLLPDGRTVRTTNAAISIDAAEFADAATSDETSHELSVLQRQFADTTVLLGVDRLDYTKGIVERLEAFELLLERRADLRGKVTLIQIAVPSRGDVREYRELRDNVERITGRINGRFTQHGRDVPVHYLHRSLPRHRLLAYYCLADTMLVTPLKDGMNLVAKEYVVAQAARQGSGALVLSEFTGAALELTEAVTCNPFDVEGLSMRIEKALELPLDDRRRRLRKMARKVRTNDVHRWLGRQLDDLMQTT